MQAIILSIWVTQGILMFFDEFVFHHKRRLGKWESLGHPIDSLFFSFPFLYALIGDNNLYFIILCILSCLIITKDEFVHQQECEAKEQWLHSLLFIIHPIALYGLYIAKENNLTDLIVIQVVIIFSFLIYQFLYWNLYAKTKSK